MRSVGGSAQGTDGVGDGRAASAPRGRGRVRGLFATLLITLGCLLAPVGVLAIWAGNQISDTERYVSTVAPLASSPPVQAAVADRVTDAVMREIDVPGAVNGAIDAAESRGLPVRLGDRLTAVAGPVGEAVSGFVHDKALQVVRSPAFATLWTDANRVAHRQLDAVLSGDGSKVLQTEGDTVSVDLGPLVQAVEQRLVDSGLTFASAIPDVHPTFPIAQSEALVKAQLGYQILNALRWALPVVAVLLIAAGVLLARGRRRALARAGFGLAVAMALLGAGLAVGRGVYLDQVAARGVDTAAAEAVYDTLVRFVRSGLRAALVLGLVIAVGAYLTGSSSTAVRVRTACATALGRLRGGGDGVGWAGEHKRILQAAVMALGITALAFWERPTGLVVLALTALVLLGLAVVEVLGGPAARRAP